MISFEQAFTDMEKLPASTVKSAAEVSKHARALEKAAKEGNITAAKRAQQGMNEALNALRQEDANSIESWPFGAEEEQQYLNESYSQELRAVAAGKGLDIYERDGRMIAHPSVVRVLPGQRAVTIDRKQVSTIRPSRLIDILLENQRRGHAFGLRGSLSPCTGYLRRLPRRRARTGLLQDGKEGSRKRRGFTGCLPHCQAKQAHNKCAPRVSIPRFIGPALPTGRGWTMRYMRNYYVRDNAPWHIKYLVTSPEVCNALR